MTLQDAKRELKESWIPGYGYDYDQNFIVCYKDGEVVETRESNSRLPQSGIIGIQFYGSDGQYSVGKELFNGKLIDLV